ncbi:MAG: NUDIX domain-containing protein [Patescibacteria group bacterium]|nr:NUDIX domain-containing protein [Patescibacteria group bacterium]
MEKQNLSPEELAILAELLGRIDPKKPLGTELFNMIARVSVSVGFETLALRQGDEGVEIFLTQRRTNEAYAGEYHSPGTILRPGEEMEDAFKRLEEEEFKSKLISWKFIGFNNYLTEVRGHSFAVLYLCELDDSSDNWFPVDDLPQPMVNHHEKIIIPKAVAAFKKFNTK